MFNIGSLLALTAFLTVTLSLVAAKDGPTVDSGNGNLGHRRLSILLACLPFPGHITPTVALGEELVSRGHHVTLCTTELEGKDLAKTKTKESGIKLVSAGQGFVSYSEYLSLQARGDFKNFTGLWEDVRKGLKLLPEESNSIGKVIDGLNVSEFDVIVGNEFLSAMTACLSRKYGVRGMILSTTLQFHPNHLPPWPFRPLATSKRGTLKTSEDFSFLERLSFVLLNQISKLIWAILDDAFVHYLEFTDSEKCPVHYASLYPGVFAPQIVPTAIGFEYPRTMSPLTHYVGPIIGRKQQLIPRDMLTWLNDRVEASVMYISMGSTAVLYRGHAVAIVSAVKATGMYVLWSLRDSNRGILEGLDYNSQKIRIYNWTPQISVLNHSSVCMALLHGGMNGLNEALYLGVPVIAVPSTNDQGDSAARLDHSGAGIQILKTRLNNDTLVSAIQSIQSGSYVP